MIAESQNLLETSDYYSQSQNQNLSQEPRYNMLPPGHQQLSINRMTNSQCFTSSQDNFFNAAESRQVQNGLNIPGGASFLHGTAANSQNMLAPSYSTSQNLFSASSQNMNNFNSSQRDFPGSQQVLGEGGDGFSLNAAQNRSFPDNFSRPSSQDPYSSSQNNMRYNEGNRSECIIAQGTESQSLLADRSQVALTLCNSQDVFANAREVIN